MGQGGSYRNQVGSNDASFLPAAAEVCHCSLELPAPFRANCCVLLLVTTAGLAGGLDPRHCRHVKACHVPRSCTEAAAALLPPPAGFSLCRFHLQIQLPSSLGAKGGL